MMEFQRAGLRYARAIPEQEQERAANAGLVVSALRGFDRSFNLAAGDVLSAAVVAMRVSASASVHYFVESLPCRMPLKPVPTGEGPFQVSATGFILSREKRSRKRFGRDWGTSQRLGECRPEHSNFSFGVEHPAVLIGGVLEVLTGSVHVCVEDPFTSGVDGRPKPAA